jgi:hypothetical protein
VTAVAEPAQERLIGVAMGVDQTRYRDHAAALDSLGSRETLTQCRAFPDRDDALAVDCNRGVGNDAARRIDRDHDDVVDQQHARQPLGAARPISRLKRPSCISIRVHIATPMSAARGAR